jgi:hypothetical protein
MVCERRCFCTLKMSLLYLSKASYRKFCPYQLWIRYFNMILFFSCCSWASRMTRTPVPWTCWNDLKSISSNSGKYLQVLFSLIFAIKIGWLNYQENLCCDFLQLLLCATKFLRFRHSRFRAQKFHRAGVLIRILFWFGFCFRFVTWSVEK